MSLAFQGSPAENPRDDVTASAAEAAVLLPQERVHLYFPYTTVWNICQVVLKKYYGLTFAAKAKFFLLPFDKLFGIIY